MSLYVKPIRFRGPRAMAARAIYAILRGRPVGFKLRVHDGRVIPASGSVVAFCTFTGDVSSGPAMVLEWPGG